MTPAGHRILSMWMKVVSEERAALEAVLKRYDNLGADVVDSVDEA